MVEGEKVAWHNVFFLLLFLPRLPFIFFHFPAHPPTHLTFTTIIIIFFAPLARSFLLILFKFQGAISSLQFFHFQFFLFYFHPSHSNVRFISIIIFHLYDNWEESFHPLEEEKARRRTSLSVTRWLLPLRFLRFTSLPLVYNESAFHEITSQSHEKASLEFLCILSHSSLFLFYDDS